MKRNWGICCHWKVQYFSVEIEDALWSIIKRFTRRRTKDMSEVTGIDSMRKITSFCGTWPTCGVECLMVFASFFSVVVVIQQLCEFKHLRFYFIRSGLSDKFTVFCSMFINLCGYRGFGKPATSFWTYVRTRSGIFEFFGKNNLLYIGQFLAYDLGWK